MQLLIRHNLARPHRMVDLPATTALVVLLKHTVLPDLSVLNGRLACPSSAQTVVTWSFGSGGA